LWETTSQESKGGRIPDFCSRPISETKGAPSFLFSSCGPSAQVPSEHAVAVASPLRFPSTAIVPLWDLMNAPPAYAAATLAYGIYVNPYYLIYSARAYFKNGAAFNFIRAALKRRIRCSPGRRVSVESMPAEVLTIIESHLTDATREEAHCKSWLFFGEKEKHKYHPEYCCSVDALPEEQWSARVQEDWDAARDEFRDWFSFAIPECKDPCTGHHVCQVCVMPHPLLSTCGTVGSLIGCPFPNVVPSQLAPGSPQLPEVLAAAPRRLSVQT